jgi:hypothetical protein
MRLQEDGLLERKEAQERTNGRRSPRSVLHRVLQDRHGEPEGGAPSDASRSERQRASAYESPGVGLIELAASSGWSG